MMTKVTCLFYLVGSKKKSDQRCPLYLRITVNSGRSEISLGKFIDPLLWDDMSQTVRGKSDEARELNGYLISLRATIQRIQLLYLERKEVLTAELLKEELTGKPEQEKTFLVVFEEHNRYVDDNIGEMFSELTASQYKRTKQRLEVFLREKYNRSDIPLSSLDRKFILQFDSFLRVKYGLTHNTVMKHLKQVKRVIHMAMSFGYMDRDPFDGHKTTYKETNRGFLTMDDLDRLVSHEFNIKRLDVVRDIFVFACYTGLSYSDLPALTRRNIMKGDDGKDWIVYERKKTGVKASIPLLPPAMVIMEKYKDDRECLKTGTLLPVRSDQKLNAYLQEIADICGLSRRPTMHVARHTFATTVTLSNGVHMETVQKMLGHAMIKTTQIYSKVLLNKISEEMENVRQRLFKEPGESTERKEVTNTLPFKPSLN
jgi:site-specific recombinase XerD